jgi:hypothetical protein
MSRAKGPHAQAGAPRWRNEPDQDAYNRSQDHRLDGGYEDDAYTQQQPQSHFPHHAFRQLGGEREQPALSRGSLASLLNRTAAANNPPPAEERRRPSSGTSQRWTGGNADPAGYDLANYTPEQGHAQGGRHAPAHDQYAQQGYDSAAAEGWTGGQWHGQNEGYQQQGYAQGSLDDLAYDPRAGYDDGQHDYGYEGEEAEEAPRRRGPRAVVVLGALVGAIAVGGGLAYGYKSFNGASDGKTPLVRADKGPAKAKPVDPGGKDIAHTDKRFLNRLGEDRPPGTIVQGAGASGTDRAAASDSDSNGAPRKVTTLVVNRDGSMGAANPVITPTQQASGGNSGSGVPGLFVEGLGSQPQRPPLRGTASSEGQGTQTAPVAPRVISRAEPIVEAKADPKPDPTPEQQARVPVKKAAPRDDYVAPQAQSTKVASAANTAVPAATATGSGFVPVLSSQKSRMDALKAFADMQQKYTDVLQGRAPDVREVDLGQKGVWHRLMLGPPGSREAANNVCIQLKAHGYTGCWITTY